MTQSPAEQSILDQMKKRQPIIRNSAGIEGILADARGVLADIAHYPDYHVRQACILLIEHGTSHDAKKARAIKTLIEETLV